MQKLHCIRASLEIPHYAEHRGISFSKALLLILWTTNTVPTVQLIMLLLCQQRKINVAATKIQPVHLDGKIHKPNYTQVSSQEHLKRKANEDMSCSQVAIL